jgi:hypothetical protein
VEREYQLEVWRELLVVEAVEGLLGEELGRELDRKNESECAEEL